MTWKTIGIVGGLGPLATVEFERRLFSRVPATKDQDFPAVLCFNNAQVPDRTQALVADGKTPAPELARTARALARAGARVLCMPCNTAHAFRSAVAAAAPKAAFVDIVHEAVARALREAPDARTIGILCTDGTRRSGVYEDVCRAYGVRAAYPSENDQEDVMRAIYGEDGLKRGGRDAAGRLAQRALDGLAARRVDAVIVACTELSLVPLSAEVPVVDALDVLAEAVLREARR